MLNIKNNLSEIKKTKTKKPKQCKRNFGDGRREWKRNSGGGWREWKYNSIDCKREWKYFSRANHSPILMTGVLVQS